MSKGSRRPHPATPTGQLRIVGGRWRSRKLHFPDIKGLRPTGDRLRETLFNWLAGDIPGSRCLDTFAGSGALGFEALSRGADAATFLESDPRACSQLQQTRRTLEAQAADIVEGDAMAWLARGRAPGQAAFNIAFIDPPFGADLAERACRLLDSGHWLAPGARIYVETGPDEALTAPAGWQLRREKQTGQVHCRLFVRD